MAPPTAPPTSCAGIDDPRFRLVSDGTNRGLCPRLNQIASLARGLYLARMEDRRPHASRHPSNARSSSSVGNPGRRCRRYLDLHDRRRPDAARHSRREHALDLRSGGGTAARAPDSSDRDGAARMVLAGTRTIRSTYAPRTASCGAARAATRRVSPGFASRSSSIAKGSAATSAITSPQRKDRTRRFFATVRPVAHRLVANVGDSWRGAHARIKLAGYRIGTMLDMQGRLIRRRNRPLKETPKARNARSDSKSDILRHAGGGTERSEPLAARIS